MSPEDPIKDANNPEKSDEFTAFAKKIVIEAALIAAKQLSSEPRRRGRRHVSRKSSSARGRKGPVQGARRIQAPDRRALQRGVLHHQHRWAGGGGLSGGGVAAHRGQAGETFELQSCEEKISEQSELLRADGRNGWAGPATSPPDFAGSSGAEEGRSHLRQSDLPRSSQHGSFEADGRGRVHGRR